MSLLHPRLLLITDRKQARTPLREIVAAALAAGCRWVSLREKDLPAADQTRLIQSLKPLTRSFHARLTIHGDAEIARAAAVDGVHLPAGSNVAEARALMGPDAVIGISVHGASELKATAASAPDYAIAGPVFETVSKPGYGPTLGPAGLAAMVAAAPVPVIAIGGITAANVRDVLTAGVAGIAIMGEAMRAADPGKIIRELLAALEASPDYPRPR